MEDVKPNVEVDTQSTQVEAETTPTQEPNKTEVPEVPEQQVETQVAPERTVSYSALKEERERRKELQRKLAEYEARSEYQQQSSQGEVDIMAHPFVRDLMIKQATRDLQDFARDILDQHPNVPDLVKKAILRNPRGYVNEKTQDIENAKLDLQEYIESIEEEIQPTKAVEPKSFPVASTNATSTKSATRPADIAKLLEKPVEDWTDDEAKMVEEYKNSIAK